MINSSSSRRLAERMAPEIAALPPGAQVPTHRELVRRFGVSATTVADALALLVRQGVVESRPGAGAFRTQTRPIAPPGDSSWQETALALTAHGDAAHGSPRSFDAPGLLATLGTPAADVIDLNGGYLHPELQPLAMLSAALARAGRRPEAWNRPPIGGLPELRDWFAADIGGGLGRHDVLICGAGQGALATALRALAQPGDPVVVESPSYPGATAAAVAAGLHPIAVPLDGEGLRADELDAVLARTHARVVVLQPLHQNPTGISLSSRRAGELLEVARRHRAFIVEDDFARHLVHHDARPPAPPLVADDPDGVVVHIRSLTKATSPNLRVGALAGRGPVMARLRSALVIDTMFVPAPLQHTALEVVTSPGWRRSLGTLAKALRHRREVAADALAASMPDGARLQAPRGGYHLWVPLPPHADSRAFAAAALRLGVAVTPGDNYFPAGRGAPHVRLSYVAAPSPADVNEAIRRLAAVALEPAP